MGSQPDDALDFGEEEEEPLTVAELALDMLCGLEFPDDLVEFMGETASLLNR